MKGGSENKKRFGDWILRAVVDVQWTHTRFDLVHNIGKIHMLGAIP
jgi:hypothetical protein